MPRPVLDVVRDHWELEARIGGYEAQAERAEEIDRVYEALGELLGCPARNIAIMENATAAFVQALSAIPFREGDVLLTTRNDYASNQIQYLSLAERFGVEILRAPDSPDGGVDVKALGKLIHRRRPRLVSITTVPTNSGLVQDAAAVARLCRERDVWCLVDACQSVGQMPVDVGEIPCDFLSATGRKFLRGPRGTGFLYVSDRALEAGLTPLFPDIRGADWIAEDLYQPLTDARRFESWEFAYALVLGMGEAVRYAITLGLEAIQARTWSLGDDVRAALSRIDRVRVLDQGAELCGIVTITVEGHSPEQLVASLGERGINTSWSDLGSGLLDFQDKGVESALRISPHYFNTGEELERLEAELRQIVSE